MTSNNNITGTPKGFRYVRQWNISFRRADGRYDAHLFTLHRESTIEEAIAEVKATYQGSSNHDFFGSGLKLERIS